MRLASDMRCSMAVYIQKDTTFDALENVAFYAEVYAVVAFK